MLRLAPLAAGISAAVSATLLPPEQVRLAFTDAPSAMVVHWATSNVSTPEDYAGSVQWGSSPGSLSGQATAVNSNYTIFKMQSFFFHNAEMSPLDPSSTYFYRVGCDAYGWSDVFNFTSAPPVGDVSVYPVKFISYGDFGIEHSIPTANLSGEFIKSGYAKFIIHAGDASYADDRANDGHPELYEGVQNTFYNQVQQSAAYAPYMQSSGNHEILGDWIAYKTRISPTMPTAKSGSPFWYSWSYGPVFFMAFDSDQSHTVGSDQYNWIVAALKGVDRSVTPWVVAYNHFPMACSNYFWCVPSSAPLRAIYEPIFNAPETKVDIYIAGHVHAAEVLYPQVNLTVLQQDFTDVNVTMNVMVGFPGDMEVCCNDWLKPKPAYSYWRDDDVASDGGTFGLSVIEIANLTHARVAMWDAVNRTEILSQWISRIPPAQAQLQK